MKGTHRIRPLATLIAGVGFVLTLLLLTVCAARGANPAAPGVQVVSNETYTLTLIAKPDVTAIRRGKQVTKK